MDTWTEKEEKQLARIGWIEHRLNNWARWSAERASRGLGLPRQSAFLRAASAPRSASVRNSVPTNDLDALQTEQAVQALRGINGVLHAAVVHHYLRDVSGQDLADRLGGVSVRRAYQRIEEAHQALATWFNDQRAIAAKAREQHQIKAG